MTLHPTYGLINPLMHLSVSYEDFRHCDTIQKMELIMNEDHKGKIGISVWFCILAVGSVLVVYKAGPGFKSVSRADLGTFGDYFGGILNPIFAAANLVLLVYISLWVAGNDRQKEEREERRQRTIALYSIRQDAVSKLILILDKVHLITLGSYTQDVQYEMGKINIELGVFLATNYHVFPALREYDKGPISECINQLGTLIQAYFSAVTNVTFGTGHQLDLNRADGQKAAMMEGMQNWNQLRGELTGILISYIQID